MLQAIEHYLIPKDLSIWQGALLDAILIPFVIIAVAKIIKFYDSKRPGKLLLSKFCNQGKRVLIFTSQLSSLLPTGGLNLNPQYVAIIPHKTPTGTKILTKGYQNIDPVWSEADGECLADIYNVLGKVDKTENIDVGNINKHLDDWDSSIFSVGFNYKTDMILKKYKPVHFSLKLGGVKLKNSKKIYSYINGVDHSVIQKTLNEDTGQPAFVLAGMGTLGTAAAGYYFRNNYIDMGKMFGDESFVILLSANLGEGKTSARMIKSYPKIKTLNKIFHPIVYWEKYRKTN